MEKRRESQEMKCQQRVQFTDDTFEVGHDSDISIRYISDCLINVHLGFLQVRHRYGITFTFESPKCIDGSLVIRSQDSSCPNLNVHVIDLRRLDNGNTPLDAKNDSIKYKITIELFAHKEKLLKEQIFLHSSQNASQTLSLVFHARVLGKGKGTPFLKNGIKCIGIEMDEEEDNSDWPGFSN